MPPSHPVHEIFSPQRRHRHYATFAIIILALAPIAFLAQIILQTEAPASTAEANVGTADAATNSTADQDHPWWWIGLLKQLEGEDVDSVTSTLTEYASDKTSYVNPDEFLSACNQGQFPDGRCDFIGGPDDKFSSMAPHVMKVLRDLGMKESSRVLEVGAGLGRNSKSMIEFLNSGMYCGIEPNGDMLAVGVAHMIGSENMQEKKPRFSTNYGFDFSVFGNEPFDVVTSRSVWTHTSKVQIEQYLASFAKNSGKDAILVTSVLNVTEDCSEDYNGIEWVGKSHNADNIGVVIHCMPWLREACKKEGLTVKSLAEDAPALINRKDWDDLGQPWIVIRHDKTE